MQLSLAGVEGYMPCINIKLDGTVDTCVVSDDVAQCLQ